MITLIKFILNSWYTNLDGIMGYHDLLEILEEQHQHKLENNACWQLKQITGHSGS